jgi:hypothetical protein
MELAWAGFNLSEALEVIGWMTVAGSIHLDVAEAGGPSKEGIFKNLVDATRGSCRELTRLCSGRGRRR